MSVGDIDNYAGCVRYLTNGSKPTRAKSLLGIAGTKTIYDSMPELPGDLARCEAATGDSGVRGQWFEWSSRDETRPGELCDQARRLLAGIGTSDARFSKP
jgi:hypothetical protein